MADDGVVQIVVIVQVRFPALPVGAVLTLHFVPDGAVLVSVFAVAVAMAFTRKHGAVLLLAFTLASV